MFEVKCIVLPEGCKLFEDEDFVYLKKNDKVVATFNGSTTVAAILDEIMNQESQKTGYALSHVDSDIDN